jgi:uncharacterized protein YjbI with pentapeptide repeats
MLRRAVLRRADLRDSTLREATLDRVVVASAVLGPADATGASGSILTDQAVRDVEGRHETVDAEAVVAWLRDAGAAAVALPR